MVFRESKSQNPTFQLKEFFEDKLVNNGDVFYRPTIPKSTVTANFLIKNISNTAQTIHLKKSMASNQIIGPDDEARAAFCIDFHCFPFTTNTTAIALNVGQELLVQLELNEASKQTESIVNYRFTNSFYQNEVLNLTIKYNSKGAPVSVMESQLNTQDLSIYPNPLAVGSAIQLQSNFDGESNVTITNSLGEVVFSKPLSISKEQNEIELPENLDSGLYYITVSNDKGSVTKKLVVIH